ncbi:hypothetical protein HAX54_008835, partial [Datura stramonium]|nr:hypothetical protein [Datura stramonium]
ILPLYPLRGNLYLYQIHIPLLHQALKPFRLTPIAPSSKTPTTGDPVLTPDADLGNVEISDLDHDPAKGKAKEGTSGVQETKEDDDDDDVPLSIKGEHLK